VFLLFPFSVFPSPLLAAYSSEIVARVNDEPIYAAAINRELERLKQGHAPAGQELHRAQVLDHLIDRLAALQWLQSRGEAASDQEVELEVQRLEGRLRQQQITLDDFLAKSALQPEELRRAIAWRLTWRGYLAKYATDANLERYFEKHRRDFDGTRLRVAHILWKVSGPPDDVQLRQALDRAAAVRRQIASGETTFEAAAKRHSAAPTADRGGDIGLIARTDPMSEAFSQAAFALEETQISQPVVSPAGVHLIRCLAIEPGIRTWQESREPLEQAVARYLFTWLSEQGRQNARIERVGEGS
jgi:parvulin-like peptidyl-prolyl isomerase